MAPLAQWLAEPRRVFGLRSRRDPARVADARPEAPPGLGLPDTVCEAAARAARRLSLALDVRSCAVYLDDGVGYGLAARHGDGPWPERMRAEVCSASVQDDAARASAFSGLAEVPLAALVPAVLEDRVLAFLALTLEPAGRTLDPREREIASSIAEALAVRLALGAERSAAARLRRFVPPLVAESIARGREPDAGAREVSVLFADLHNYTRFAESRAPTEVFALRSLYTRSTARIVREERGIVVDVAGDGIMAVFGALGPEADREQQALRAARRVAHCLDGLDAAAALRAGGDSPVRVAVASGPAFVGCIEAGDHLLWSVTGDVTNVAARLQELARRSGACVLTDALTWARAGRPPARLLPAVPLRGRARAVDVAWMGVSSAGRSSGRMAPVFAPSEDSPCPTPP